MESDAFLRSRKSNGACFFRTKEETDQPNDGNGSCHQNGGCDAPEGNKVTAEETAGNVANGDGNGNHRLSFYLVSGRQNGVGIVNGSRCEQGKGEDLCQKCGVNHGQIGCQRNKNGFQHKEDGCEPHDVAAVPSFDESGKANHYKKFQKGSVSHDLPQFLIAFADFLKNLNHVGVDGAVRNKNQDDAQTKDSKPTIFSQYGNGASRGHNG